MGTSIGKFQIRRHRPDLHHGIKIYISQQKEKDRTHLLQLKFIGNTLPEDGKKSTRTKFIAHEDLRTFRRIILRAFTQRDRCLPSLQLSTLATKALSSTFA